METVKFFFKGLSPLMMHSERGANPLDPDVKELKTITGKKKKTDEDHELIAYMDWKLGLYFDKQLGPYVPGINVRAAIVAGGKMNKFGTALQKGTTILCEKIKLDYDGPRDLAALWNDAGFRDIRSVVVSRARTMRCRPIFPEWTLTFDFHYDTSVINMDALEAEDRKRNMDARGRVAAVAAMVKNARRLRVKETKRITAG